MKSSPNKRERHLTVARLHPQDRAMSTKSGTRQMPTKMSLSRATHAATAKIAKQRHCASCATARHIPEGKAASIDRTNTSVGATCPDGHKCDAVTSWNAEVSACVHTVMLGMCEI